MSDLEKDYTLNEVAEALSMSTRWLRGRIKADQLAHQKYGHKILFTGAQVEAIRARYTNAVPVEQSITTGRKRKAS